MEVEIRISSNSEDETNNNNNNNNIRSNDNDSSNTIISISNSNNNDSNTPSVIGSNNNNNNNNNNIGSSSNSSSGGGGNNITNNLNTLFGNHSNANGAAGGDGVGGSFPSLNSIISSFNNNNNNPINNNNNIQTLRQLLSNRGRSLFNNNQQPPHQQQNEDFYQNFYNNTNRSVEQPTNSNQLPHHNNHHHHHHHINTNNDEGESNNASTTTTTNNNNPTTTTATPTTTPVATTRLDLPSLLKWMEQNFPFIAILCIVFVYKYRRSILGFIWQQMIFISGNQCVKVGVSLKEKRNWVSLLFIILGMSTNILLTYLIYSSVELWNVLILLPPSIDIDIVNAFWVTIINDFMVRDLTIIIKAICVILIGHRPPFKRRAQLYTVIEVTSNLYRSILPIVVWFKYLNLLHSEGENIFGSLMVGLYFTFKLTSLVEKGKQWFHTIKAYHRGGVLYGRVATSAQLAAAGDICSICQETMDSPIVLWCDHIFCEDCISKWFETQKTCPLCRSVITTAGSRTHSDGTTSLLFQIF